MYSVLADKRTEVLGHYLLRPSTSGDIIMLAAAAPAAGNMYKSPHTLDKKNGGSH